MHHHAKRWVPVLLILLLGGYWLFFTLTTPSRAFVNWLPGIPPSYDADMAYVYNSILPFEGRSYAHVYHPGTAMHIVGTALGALAYPVAALRGETLAAFHAGNPFPLLTGLRALLGVLGCTVSVLLFRRAVPLTGWRGVLQGAAVSVSFFAIYVFGFISLVSWAHASMGHTVGGLILLWLLALVTSDTAPRPQHIIGIGAAAGALNATAYYYLPFVVTVALALGAAAWVRRGGSHAVGVALGSGLAAVGGFLLANAPIWHKFGVFVGSFTRLASYTGTHGSGERGLVSLVGLVDGALAVYTLYPTPFWVLGGLVALSVGVAFVQRGRLRQHAALWGLQAALIVHVALGFLLIFRHPGGSYLNIVVPAAPFMLAVLFRLMTGPRERQLAVGIAAAVLVGFSVQYVNAVQLHLMTTREAQAALTDADLRITNYAAQTGQRPEDVLIVTTYGAHFGCYGMWFGSGYSEYVLHEYVAAACPNMVEFRGGFDGAQVRADEWRLLTDADFCWDMAILADWNGSGLLSEFGAPQTTEGGYTIVVNDRIFREREAYRVDFDQRPCGRGWHSPQRDGDVTYAWTATPEATVEMRLATGTDYTLTARLYAAIAPDVQGSLTATVNGERIALTPTDAPNTYTGVIPAAVVAQNPHATPLMFTTNRTESPGAENGDPRQLGVAVDWIEIVPADRDLQRLNSADED